MPAHHLLQIEIDEVAPPEGAIALLIPVPPTTPHQTLREARLPASWTAEALVDSTGVQRALLAEFPRGAHRQPITFALSDRGELVRGHFDRREDTARLAADVFELAEDIGLLECDGETARLRKIVDALASKFQYRSGFSNDAPLTCDVLTGNCLSINEAFLKLAKVAGIPSAYYIGYFFESEKPLKSRDWHCWVSTLGAEGFESWDIAHHLKRGLGAVRAALNPVPGVRFATSVGRNLSFRVPAGQVDVPHLCEPRWIMSNGAAVPCEVTVLLRREKEGQDDVATGLAADSPDDAPASKTCSVKKSHP
jgi:hypothetical protein